MPIGPNNPYTNLDQNQILQRSFEESEDRLRVDAQVTAVLGTVECIIDAASGDNIKISDGTDTLKVNSDGSINVVVSTSSTPGTQKVLYGEVNAVTTGITEVILNFNPSVDTQLTKIDVSGTNIATYEIMKNSSVINRKRTSFGSALNADFDFSGLMLESGDNLQILVVHERPYTGDFNATLNYIEV